MEVNKVVYNGDTLLDLTSDTVTPQTLVKGTTAHDKSGANITGTADYAISSTSTTSPLTDSANGMVQGLTIYGRSEVVEGAIKSIGDAGWGVVDLGTLDWTYVSSNSVFYAGVDDGEPSINTQEGTGKGLCSVYNIVQKTYDNMADYDMLVGSRIGGTNKMYICAKNNAYTDATAFKSAMSGVLLYYPLADTTGATPTFGITSKNGAGQGTAATITTGLPLRSVSDSITDELTETKVIKKCAEVDLGTLTWEYTSNRFQAQLSGSSVISGGVDAICDNYTLYKGSLAGFSEADKSINVGNLQLTSSPYVLVRDTSYTDTATFTTAVTGVKLVYPLATPTETPLTSAEKSALASLRTYDHTTHIDATDAPTMTVDYLLNTNNGKAVANIKKDLQEQIDDKITVSPPLTLTVAGWDTSTLQQTVLYSHNPSYRNIIDVDPASVEEWAAFGIIARNETASDITFTCKSIPENALLFKVTSMGV